MHPWKTYDLFTPSEEHRMLREMVRDFVRNEVEPQAHKFDREERFNNDLFQKAADLGLLGITVSEELGGTGLDATAACLVHEELAWSDPGFALAYLAHSMLCVNNIMQNASEEQKTRYLPKLCHGEWIGAMAISEPSAGTDVLGMQTTAVRDGQNYKINGRKMWITNGTVDESGTPADVVWVYALTKGSDGKKKVSTFIVDRSCPGYSVGQKIKDKLGMRASNTAELVFDNCVVPAANLVGEEGASFLHMMKNLELERVTLAAISVGIAKRALEVMSRYANEREAFGSPIHKFGQVQEHIACSYSEYRAARTYMFETARKMDLGQAGNRLDSDGVKLVAAGVAKRIADRAIQVLGGYGYVGEYVVERLWRDAKLIEIGGGTNEAHQKNITNDIEKDVGILNNL